MCRVPQENSKTPVCGKPMDARHVLRARRQQLAAAVALRVLCAWFRSIVCALSVQQALYTPAQENPQLVQAIQIRLLVL